MTPQTPRAALSDADIERVAFQSWAAKAAPFINDKRDRDDSGGNLAAAVAWLAWQAAADRRLTAEQGGAASDRKLFEALSKYIHCVLQELQFERGTGSLAAHNLRLCLIEVDKALRGERDSAMNVGVGFPLEGVVAALTTQPQTIIDPAVIAPRECSITEGPRDRDRQAAQPQAVAYSVNLDGNHDYLCWAAVADETYPDRPRRGLVWATPTVPEMKS